LLLTAGPTREPIDPVRFLSNRSTGRMGFAIAEAAVARGMGVDLVLGPVEAEAGGGVDVTRVETARQMLDAALALLPRATAIVCAAAVCDYRVAAPSASKIKRGGPMRLDLVENPDIAAALGAAKGARPMAIFALETDAGADEARKKLLAKNADLCVLNSPEAIGAEVGRFRLLRRDGLRWTDFPPMPKGKFARLLLEQLLG